MFLRSWLNLIILLQLGILPSNSVEDKKKKGCYCILVLSQSRISDFLLPSRYYLPENQRIWTYFAPFSVTFKGAPPPDPPGLTRMVFSFFYLFFPQY